MRIKKILRLPKWLLILALISAGGAYYWEVQQRENQAYQGVPRLQSWSDWRNWHRVLRNQGFMVGYSELRMNPLWVTYRLEAAPPGAIGSRPSSFSQDKRSLARVAHQDYTGSGYDRGHLAPNYAIAKVHGREAQLQTFLMTNISPQTANLNRRVWQRIEQIAMDHFAPLKQEVWVITGPVFAPQTARLPNTYIQIPTAFYKIFIAPATAERPIKVLAFLVPQDVQGQEVLSQFLTSVRSIEEATGLDFLHRLPAQQQESLETSIQPEPWLLDKVEQQLGRF